MYCSKQLTEKGFTLVELLATVATTGILSSIAIHHFAEYKKASFDAIASSDLKTAVIAQEAFHSDNASYLECVDAMDCEQLPGFISSKKPDGSPSLSPFSFEVDGETYQGNSTHPQGSKAYFIDSTEGNIREAP